MIEIFRSIVIGGVQGISEFLPISSSGHLVLVPYVFKWDYQGLAFDVALHFGTAIAIVAFFWKDWMKIIANAINLNKKSKLLPADKHGKNQSSISSNFLERQSNEQYDNLPQNLFWQIIIASVPAGIVGFLLNDYVEKYFHSPLLIAMDLIIFGIILWLVDKNSAKNTEIKNMSYGKSFLVGCAQAVALVPGVSRSGITITASRGLGLNRKEAAHFSFLLATPAMLGAFLFELKDLNISDLTLPFILGVISSTVFGFFAIKYLLKYLEKANFNLFVWYRIAIAVIIAAIYFAR
jgi:undecaprenyl-diphosphatase